MKILGVLVDPKELEELQAQAVRTSFENDADLAEEIVKRLNKLIEDPEVRALLYKLISDELTPATAEEVAHPTTLTTDDDKVGLLGILNGICGKRAQGGGYIWAEFLETRLERFRHVKDW